MMTGNFERLKKLRSPSSSITITKKKNRDYTFIHTYIMILSSPGPKPPIRATPTQFETQISPKGTGADT